MGIARIEVQMGNGHLLLLRIVLRLASLKKEEVFFIFCCKYQQKKLVFSFVWREKSLAYLLSSNHSVGLWRSTCSCLLRHQHTCTRSNVLSQIYFTQGQISYHRYILHKVKYLIPNIYCTRSMPIIPNIYCTKSSISSQIYIAQGQCVLSHICIAQS